MPTEKMTVKDYAQLRGITTPAVYKAIKLGHNMPGVTKVEKFGAAHVLHVDKNKLPENLEVSKT